MFTNQQVLSLIAHDVDAERQSFAAGRGIDAGERMAARLSDRLGVGDEAAENMVRFYRGAMAVGLSTPDSIAAKWKILAAAAGPRRDRSRFKAMAAAMPARVPTPRPEPPACDSSDGWEQTASLRAPEPRGVYADSDFSPFELAQLEHERQADLVSTAGHESRHAVVGVACGATIREIRVSSVAGSCHFHHIPPEFDPEITLAGSLWCDGEIWGQRASGDISFFDKAVVRENPNATPGSDLWHDRHDLAASRCNDILAEQHEVYRALKAHLIEYGHATGEEVARLWNTYGR